ncbi:hypothetical protein CYMTET_34241 [Cymbomonas tetramitiformis]|uniref:Uncharacterized protein n=1 Tax=Cymbomonas tetramitiformis TaxID=36881 RepID=A0AAE0KQE3_9CHLO|nr:hypothetical protein CYMTET_34241 [Cymbomonas tetramitiformis]
MQKHEFCVQTDAVAAHLKLVEAAVEHTEVTCHENMVAELQMPFYYENNERWEYQVLKYIEDVDLMELRKRLHKKYGGVIAGTLKAPRLTLADMTCKVNEVYPITDV